MRGIMHDFVLHVFDMLKIVAVFDFLRKYISFSEESFEFSVTVEILRPLLE